MLQPQAQPQQPSLPQPSKPTEALSMAPQESTPDASGMPPLDSGSDTEGGDIVAGLQQHLDQLPDNDKAFLAEHLTNEFVRAIGLINGPEVAGYLAQFVDPNKVMVPVPRDVAEQHLAQQQAKGQAPAQQQTQGQPVPTAPAAPPSAPQGSLMSPRV